MGHVSRRSNIIDRFCRVLLKPSTATDVPQPSQSCDVPSLHLTLDSCPLPRQRQARVRAWILNPHPLSGVFHEPSASGCPNWRSRHPSTTVPACCAATQPLRRRVVLRVLSGLRRHALAGPPSASTPSTKIASVHGYARAPLTGQCHGINGIYHFQTVAMSRQENRAPTTRLHCV